METQARTSKEAAEVLAGFSRPCRRAAHFRVVLAQFGLPVSCANVSRLPTIWETTSSKRSVVHWIVLSRTIVETEHLLLKITEQRKRLYSNVGS